MYPALDSRSFWASSGVILFISMSSPLANLEVFNDYFGRCPLARSLRIGTLPPSAQVKIDPGGKTAALVELLEFTGRLVLAHVVPMKVPPVHGNVDAVRKG